MEQTLPLVSPAPMIRTPKSFFLPLPGRARSPSRECAGSFCSSGVGALVVLEMFRVVWMVLEGVLVVLKGLVLVHLMNDIHILGVVSMT